MMEAGEEYEDWNKVLSGKSQPRHTDMIKEAIKLDRETVKSDGGPTGYYDMPEGCKTLNDLLEWLACERWGKFSLHMKDIIKAGFRFGGKEGTEQEYDANKIVYFGCRLLMMVRGKQAVRAYLQKLLDDPQFK